MHYVKYVVTVGEHSGLVISGMMGMKEIEELQQKNVVTFEYISVPIAK